MNSEAGAAVPTDRRLGIEWLQVVAQMAIGVLVVVTFRQFTQAPGKTLVAGVINAAGGTAVAAPVAVTLGNHLELLITHDIH